MKTLIGILLICILSGCTQIVTKDVTREVIIRVIIEHETINNNQHNPWYAYPIEYSIDLPAVLTPEMQKEFENMNNINLNNIQLDNTDTNLSVSW